MNSKTFSNLKNKKTKIALFGLGTVAQGFLELLSKASDLAVEISVIVIKDPSKIRPLHIKSIVTIHADSVFLRSDIDVIVELTNDPLAADKIIKPALQRNIPVITANKRTIADHWFELIRYKNENPDLLRYEASVGGAIPIFHLLDTYFKYQTIGKIRAIVNGTTNYILTQMSSSSLNFDEALQQAKELGYAESDPTSDLEGLDASYKLTILASSISKTYTPTEEILGISNISKQDVWAAIQKGKKIKLIAEIDFTTEQPSGSVKPQWIGNNDPLYFIDGVDNAILVETKESGTHLFRGEGAGALATGTAVLQDLRGIVASQPKFTTSNGNTITWTLASMVSVH